MIARSVLLTDPQLREFIDRALLPALLERFLQQHVADSNHSERGPHAPVQVECRPTP